MNIMLRVILALISGGNYLISALPGDLPTDQLGTLPFNVWVGLAVACLTGIASPSVIKAAGNMVKPKG